MKTEPGHGVRRRVVIYCRISDDREGRKYGVTRQERDGRRLAERNGDEVVKVFTDNDIGAWAGKRRPDFAAMIELLEAGGADGVIALAPTRLYRRLYDQRIRQDGLEFLELVERHRLTVETVKAGRYDLSTADGRRDAKRAALDAEYESDLIGERVRDAKTDNVREGTFRGGGRPFGYDADGMTPRSLLCPACPATAGYSIVYRCAACGTAGRFAQERECEGCGLGGSLAAVSVCEGCGSDAVIAEGSEAWHVQTVTDAVIAGDSLRSLSQDLNRRGVLSVPRRKRLPDGTRAEPTPREWDHATLRQMLLRPRNAGLMEVAGDIVGRAGWPAIVPEDTWRACKDILEHPGRRSTPGPARRWLGGSMYRCGHTGCTSSMRTSSRGRTGASIYMCRSGGHVTRDAAAVDEFVEQVTVERLRREDAAEFFLPATPGQEPTERLAARANALRAKLDQYVADHDDDLITRKQLLDGTRRTRQKLADIDGEMARRATVPMLASVPLGKPEAAEHWAGYSLDRKRAIIDAIMTVTILPGHRGRPKGHRPGDPYFDPATVHIDWRKPQGHTSTT